MSGKESILLSSTMQLDMCCQLLAAHLHCVLHIVRNAETGKMLTVLSQCYF